MTQALTSRTTAVYLYAVCHTDVPAPALAATAGHHGGGPVRTLPAGTLTAVVQDVPSADFTAEALRDRLADRAQLERCARAHHEVAALAAVHADTLPLPLATLYRSEESLRDALRADTDRLHAALARIAGREEWGVKVYAAPEPSPTGPASPAAASGRAYLDRVRGRARARQERADSALRRADRIEAALRGTAVAVRRLRAHGPETTGRQRFQLLNAACLIPRGEHAALAATVDRLRAAEEADIDVTGPWVPYSFVSPVSSPAAHSSVTDGWAGGGHAG